MTAIRKKRCVSSHDLRALAEEGLTQTEAARRLGRPLSTIHSRAKTDGIVFRRGKPGQKRKCPPDRLIRVMVNSGASASQAARVAKVARTTLRENAKRLGLTFRHGKSVPQVSTGGHVSFAETARRESARMVK